MNVNLIFAAYFCVFFYILFPNEIISISSQIGHSVVDQHKHIDHALKIVQSTHQKMQ